MPTLETPYGIVDREVLEELTESFDPHKIMTALDAVDRVRAEIDELRENLLLLHDIMTDLINGSSHAVSGGQVDILDLSEEIGSPGHDLTEAGELVWAITRDIDRLGSEEAWDARGI